MHDYIAVAFGIFVIWSFFTMSAALDRLTAEVAETKTANESLRAAFVGLADQIRETAGDADAANALADELDADQALTNAVLAGTPAEAVANDTNADIVEEVTGEEDQA